jgi:hypothetical protein
VAAVGGHVRHQHRAGAEHEDVERLGPDRRGRADQRNHGGCGRAALGQRDRHHRGGDQHRGGHPGGAGRGATALTAYENAVDPVVYRAGGRGLGLVPGERGPQFFLDHREASTRSARSVARAREMDERTVPTAQPRISAISASGRSWSRPNPVAAAGHALQS